MLSITKILRESRRIAVVGLSPKPNRPSYRVATYLIQVGYEVIPVNPGQEEILGLKCYPDLVSIHKSVDIVDIFRRASDVPPIVDSAIVIGAKVVWMQSGIVNEDAACKAGAAGLAVVMNRCIMVEHQNSSAFVIK